MGLQCEWSCLLLKLALMAMQIEAAAEAAALELESYDPFLLYWCLLMAKRRLWQADYYLHADPKSSSAEAWQLKNSKIEF